MPSITDWSPEGISPRCSISFSTGGFGGHKGNEGYNVSTGVCEDLVKAGVGDPKKVTRTALQN